jgi:NAD-dependent SIR2 family protein deacetylase
MTQIPEIVRQQTERLAERIRNADRILVGAGAGFSAGAGLSYMDEAVFRTYYPDMYRLGYRYEYQLVGMGDDEWSRGRKWAYWATHINYVRNIFPPAEPYRQLLPVLEGKDWFVVTSNCDRQFLRCGFPMERVFEYQGNYDNMGCSRHCTGHTWDNHEALQTVLAHIDHEKFECADEAVPKCPDCGADADICFRGEDWDANAQRYVDFINGSQGKDFLLLELGVGFNTPGVIRWPFERITYGFENAYLVRINTGYREYPDRTGHPELPRELAGKAESIDYDACAVVRLLHEIL